jgi:Uncharacterized Fe-S protein
MIRKRIETAIYEFLNDHKDSELWGSPIIAYADADDPYILKLREHIPGHLTPNDILDNASSVISYFIPFVRRIGDSNAIGKGPTEEWADAYIRTNSMAEDLNGHIIEELNAMGFDAAFPNVRMNENIMSIWSQRHVAYAAGLGTFGMNNMLIFDKGCCGRYFSVVTSAKIVPDVKIKQERCLQKSGNGCMSCSVKCPVSALSVKGFDRTKCYEHISKNEERVSADVCGKCVCGMPCSFRDPSSSPTLQ